MQRHQKVCHITTAHFADDVRIYQRECKSLAKVPNLSLMLVASGQLLDADQIKHFALGDIPKN
jgi:hypothetical protein